MTEIQQCLGQRRFAAQLWTEIGLNMKVGFKLSVLFIVPVVAARQETQLVLDATSKYLPPRGAITLPMRPPDWDCQQDQANSDDDYRNEHPVGGPPP